MKKLFFLPAILVLVLITGCALFKEKIKAYNRYGGINGLSLTLYSNNTFKISKGSDIVTHNWNTDILSSLFGSNDNSILIGRGDFEQFDNKLILKFKRVAVVDTLYAVSWGDRFFMMGKLDMINISNDFNNKRYRDNYSPWGWSENNKEKKEIFFFFFFPTPFNSYLLKDSLRAEIIEISRDSAEITINKGKNDGLYFGCELTDGKNFYSIKKLFDEHSILCQSELFLMFEYSKNLGYEITPVDSVYFYNTLIRILTQPKYLYLKGYL